MRRPIRRWIGWVAWSALLVFATIVIGGAVSARRRLPDLQPWHRMVLRDFRAADLKASSTLADYLAIEDAAFQRVRERIEDRLEPAVESAGQSLQPATVFASRSRLGTDWNRTQILSPAGAATGGALLVHGLTDSPYSMRSIGERPPRSRATTSWPSRARATVPCRPA